VNTSRTSGQIAKHFNPKFCAWFVGHDYSRWCPHEKALFDRLLKAQEGTSGAIKGLLEPVK
jgi:hypothetical protein